LIDPSALFEFVRDERRLAKPAGDDSKVAHPIRDPKPIPPARRRNADAASTHPFPNEGMRLR